MDAKYLLEQHGKTIILYAWLLNEAHDRGLKSIFTTLVQIPTPENAQTAIVHATVVLVDADGVERSFTGFGDANPDNVSRGPMQKATIRMAETRSKARALRDAINIGEALADDPAGDEDDAPPVVPPERKPAAVATKYATKDTRPLRDARELMGTPTPPTPAPEPPAPEWPDAATVPTPRERWMAAHQALTKKGHPPTWKLSKAAGSTPLPEEPPADLSEAKVLELTVQLESRLADLTARPAGA